MFARVCRPPTDMSNSEAAPISCTHCGHTSNTDDPVQRDTPPKVARLLRTNASPLESERQEFSQFIAEGRGRLSRLEEQISEAQVALRGFIEEKRRIEQDLIDYAAILHPVRRLPNEILAEIFLFFNHIPRRKRWSITQEETMPWTITHTSSHWRSTALSCPRLWSHIAVHANNDNPRRSHALARLLGIQLQRSAPCSLYVRLGCQADITDTHPIIQMLIPTSQRWKILWLVHLPRPLFGILSTAQSFFQSLSEVALHLESPPPDVQDITDTPLRDLFKFAPQLRSLTGHPILLRPCQLPWSQITQFLSVSGGWSSCAQILDVMVRIPNLRTCLFYNDTSIGSGPPTQTQPARLEYLRDLNLNERHENGNIGPLLERLTLPALDSLILSGTGIESIKSLRSSGHCHRLKRLSLSSKSLTDDDCLLLLEVIPSLQILSLKCPKAISAKLLCQLRDPGRDRAPLVPSLRSLSLSGYRDLDPVLLVQLKESRPGLSLNT